MGTFNGQDLGEIQSERHKISAPKISLAETSTEAGAASADTASTYIQTLLRPTRRVHIRGIFIGTIAQIRTFISAIEEGVGINTGDTTYTFSSDLRGSNFDVLVEDFDYEYVAGEPTTLEYTLVLVEGATS